MKGSKNSPYDSSIGYQSIPKFDRNADPYRSCCCHSTSAVLAIAALIILVSICGILASIGNWHFSSYHNTEYLEMLVGSGVSGVSIILAILVIVGLKTEKSSLLIIYLIWQFICIVGAVAVSAACICSLILVSDRQFEGKLLDLRPERDDETYLTAKFSLILALCAISFFGGIYIFTTILKAIEFLRQKSSYERLYRNNCPIPPVGYIPISAY